MFPSFNSDDYESDVDIWDANRAAKYFVSYVEDIMFRQPRRQHPGDEHPSDQHPGDKHPGDEHPGNQHPGDELASW